MTTKMKAKNMLKVHTTANLVELFEMTERKFDPELSPIVRGWIMDELEARNPKAFDAWIESLEDSPRAFYL